MQSKVKNVLHKLNLSKTMALTWSVSRKWTAITLLFLILENLAWMGTIYTFKFLVDSIAKPGVKADDKDLLNTILLSGAISIVYACIKGFSGYFTELQATKVNHYVDQKIHNHTLKLDFRFYENPKYLDILKRAREAGVDKPYAVVSSLLDIIKNSIMLATLGYILVAIDWMLLPMLALFVFPVLLVRIKFADKMFLLQRKNTGLERQTSYLSFLMTANSSANEIRAYSLGNYLLKKYVSIKNKLIFEKMALTRRCTIIELFSTAFATTAFFSVTAYIILGALRGETSIGDIAVFLVIFPQSFSKMQSLFAAISRLYQNNIYVNNIFELFELQPSIENGQTKANINIDTFSSDLILDKVSFQYPEHIETVLEEVSMQIPAGKIIALVGLNGAGKSTLIKLLCRLYDPVSGTITFGNNDIKDINPTEYRKKISVVFQDFVKYNLSVKENIWFGNIHDELEIDKIENASKNAGADGFINEFDDKYETILGRTFDDGHELSIGEWQKLSIARAFYSNSKLVILDEATSALDSVSEENLFHSFRSHIGLRSALVISHRLSTIRQADFIYLMSDKCIKESGTHEELMKANGLYASFYKISSGREKVAN